MKTLAFATCLFLFKVSCGQQWCPPGAQWTYDYGIAFGPSGYTKIAYQKDTIIESQSCKNLSAIQIVGKWDGVQPVPGNDTSYFDLYTFARNDSVFFWRINSFVPVYFFNAHAGDTVKYYNADPTCAEDTNALQLIIDSTGVIYTGNQVLRYYYVSNTESRFNNYPDKIVERLGDVLNYIQPYFGCATDENGYFLRCYQDDSFPLYQTDTTIACDYLYTSVQNQTFNTSISLFPNPTSQSFELQLSELPAGETNFQLYNGLGQLVMLRHITVTNTTFNKEDLSNGIYFWQLETNGQILKRGKVVFE